MWYTVKKLLEKREIKQLFIKEEKRLFNKLIHYADTYFSKFIRTRDHEKWCITKNLDTCQNKIDDCCHWISRSFYSHRRDEYNCYWGCASCNSYHKQEHWMEFTRIQTHKHWIERVDKQMFERNKIKPTIEELIEIIKKYK